MSVHKHDDDFFYEHTRKQIEHEDILLNHRLTWLIALQGLFYSAYGFAIRIPSSCTTNNFSQKSDPLIQSLSDTLPIIGIATSFCIFIGIFAAGASIHVLAKKWHHKKITHTKYPQIIGNYEEMGTIAGLIPTFVLPLIFSIAWTFLQPVLMTKTLTCLQLLATSYLFYKNFISNDADK